MCDRGRDETNLRSPFAVVIQTRWVRKRVEWRMLKVLAVLGSWRGLAWEAGLVENRPHVWVETDTGGVERSGGRRDGMGEGEGTGLKNSGDAVRRKSDGCRNA